MGHRDRAMTKARSYRMNKGTFNIMIRGKSGPHEHTVGGHISEDGLLGIHFQVPPNEGRKFLVVTHMKSGQGLGYDFEKFDAAKKFCRLIKDEKFLNKSLEQFNMLSVKTRDAIRERLDKCYEKACKEQVKR